MVERARPRHVFSKLQPQRSDPLPQEAVRGLPRLRLRVEAVVPALVRGLVALAVHPASLAGDTGKLVSSLNRRRRAATEWVRSILDGAIDPATLRNVGEVWLPALIGGRSDVVRSRARACVEYLRGAMHGVVMTRPEDNLVPEARTLFAIDSILARHLGAVLDAAERHGKAPAHAPTKLAR